MANEVFVDTSGFYACLVKRDNSHRQAADLLKKYAQGRRRFVTTDYVLDETSTLLKTRGHGHLIGSFFDIVFVSRACRIEWMDADRFTATRDLFCTHDDHAYSFTDCFSFLVMKQLRLQDALSKDEHFREAGFHALLR